MAFISEKKIHTHNLINASKKKIKIKKVKSSVLSDTGNNIVVVGFRTESQYNYNIIIIIILYNYYYYSLFVEDFGCNM